MKIKEAVERSIRLGRHKNQCAVARELWPDKSGSVQNARMSNKMRGLQSNFSECDIVNMCRVLDVDANYLFGINSRLPSWHDVREEQPTEQGLYIITNGAKIRSAIWDAAKKEFYFYSNGNVADIDNDWRYYMYRGE
jgi:hypothetical protein